MQKKIRTAITLVTLGAQVILKNFDMQTAADLIDKMGLDEENALVSELKSLYTHTSANIDKQDLSL